VIFSDFGVDKIKDLLTGVKDTLILIGGAMMKSFPTEMAEILEHVKTYSPEAYVYTTTLADFPEGIEFPPSEVVVNQSAVTICMKLLKK